VRAETCISIPTRSAQPTHTNAVKSTEGCLPETAEGYGNPTAVSFFSRTANRSVKNDRSATEGCPGWVTEMSQEPERRRRCRLTLSIEGVHFSVRPNRSEDETIRRAFRLRRLPLRSQIIFDVAETVHGAVCDCPDFVFRRDGLDPRGCLHIRAMRAVGLLDPL
jgi:hypothetical protein